MAAFPPALADWATRADQLGARSIPFAFLLDFELQAPVLFETGAQDLVMRLGTEHLPFGSFPVRGPERPRIAGVDPPPPEVYRRAFDLIQTAQRNGESWLANLTMKTRIDLHACSSLQELGAWVEAPFTMWHRNGDDEFLCFSPEPFVTTADNTLRTYPMKGTRKVDAQGSGQAGLLLLGDPKEEAEHVTVVDLLRNDVGMVAGKVRVPTFRHLETIKNSTGELVATSSTIEGDLVPGWQATIGTLVATMLPAGSVSGAPKRRTCERLAEAEAHLARHCGYEPARGYYTGVAGWFDGQELRSWVLIRYIESQGGLVRYCSGGGITLYADWESEYQEALDKVYLPLGKMEFA